jgi:hypothetical protein
MRLMRAKEMIRQFLKPVRAMVHSIDFPGVLLPGIFTFVSNLQIF